MFMNSLPRALLLYSCMMLTVILVTSFRPPPVVVTVLNQLHCTVNCWISHQVHACCMFGLEAQLVIV